MAIIPFPVGPSCFSEGWRIENAARSSGASTTGVQQFVASPAGRWRGRASFHCIDDVDYLEVDGFLAALDGSANTFLFGPVDWRGRPWNVDPLVGGNITPNLSRGSAEIDPAFDTNPDTTGRLAFSLAAAASMNATALRIRREKGGALRRGQYLSIGQRLHMITALTTADPTDASSGLAVAGEIGVTVRPWLRQDYASGTAVEMANPMGLMRLAPDFTGSLERVASPLSDISIDFTEAF